LAHPKPTPNHAEEGVGRERKKTEKSLADRNVGSRGLVGTAVDHGRLLVPKTGRRGIVAQT